MFKRVLPLAAASFLLGVVALMLGPAAEAGPKKTRFVSKRYHYSITLPGRADAWFAELATKPWSHSTIEPNSPALDRYTNFQTNRLYFVASRRTPAGATTLAKWTAFVLAARPTVCQAQPTFSNSTLGGARARVARFKCTDGYDVIQITALHAHRGYLLNVTSQTSVSTRAADRRAFNAARRSFHFL